MLFIEFHIERDSVVEPFLQHTPDVDSVNVVQSSKRLEKDHKWCVVFVRVVKGDSHQKVSLFVAQHTLFRERSKKLQCNHNRRSFLFLLFAPHSSGMTSGRA